MAGVRKWVLVFVAGGVGGAACDQIHVRSHALAYHGARLVGQPWWVAPQFGVAVAAMLLAAAPIARASRRSGQEPARGAVLAADGAWFLGSYVATGLWGRSAPVPVAAVLTAVWVARALRRADRAVLGIAGAALAAGGVLYEGTLCGAGVFRYLHPAAYHVPVWLFALYLQGSPLLVDAARSFHGVDRPAFAGVPAGGSPR